MSNNVRVAIVATITILLMVWTAGHLTSDSARGVIVAEALAGAFFSMLVCGDTES